MCVSFKNYRGFIPLRIFKKSLTKKNLILIYNYINNNLCFMPFGAIGSVVSTFLGNKGIQDSNQQNYNNQVELWKMQNDYNKPENQMKRLKEAGLNPNLVYGGGATTTAGPIGYTPNTPENSIFGGISDAFNNYMNRAGQREERLLRKQAIENAKEKDDATTEIARAEAGIKKEQLEEAKLNNVVNRAKIRQDMDINKTTEIRNQENHDILKPYKPYSQSMVGKITSDATHLVKGGYKGLVDIGKGLYSLGKGVYNKYYRR